MESQETELQVGDVVVLKSGGPGMTVCDIYKPEPESKNKKTRIFCQWFARRDGNEQLFDNVFFEPMLVNISTTRCEVAKNVL